MLSISAKGPFTCINCGQGRSSSVYKVYGQNEKDVPVTHMKLTECPACKKFVDDYVELDSCILFLDALLQKPRFYRHLLINCNLTNRLTVKVFILFLLTDTIFSWSRNTSVETRSTESSYVELEFAFYWTFIRCLMENVIFCFFLIINLRCWFQVFDKEIPDKEILTAIIYSSFPKVFKILTILWVSEFQTLSIIMLDILHVLSVTQSLHVVVNRNRSKFKESDAQIINTDVTHFSRIPLILLTALAKSTYLSLRSFFP